MTHIQPRRYSLLVKTTALRSVLQVDWRRLADVLSSFGAGLDADDRLEGFAWRRVDQVEIKVTARPGNIEEIAKGVAQEHVIRRVEDGANAVAMVAVLDEQGQLVTGAAPREKRCDGDHAEPWRNTDDVA